MQTSIRITGETPLRGAIPISGSKNAALPLLASTLLSKEPLFLQNVPDLSDILSMITLLKQHGSNISFEKNTCSLHTKEITDIVAPYELVKKMRASILVLGPLLARQGEAKVSLPGGCAIGTRPVNVHLEGLKQLGASITLEDGYIHAKAPKGLKGATIVLPLITVTGTENLMMAAALAEGTTTLVNAAQEPEIIDLAHCLKKMGAKIEGEGTSTITIEGVSSLNSATHSVLPDRIETGTYAMAALITNGHLKLLNTKLSLISALAHLLEESGASVKEIDNGFTIERGEPKIKGIDAMTEPYPGLATDLQAQFMALMTLSSGASMITETIFENRFMHVPELCRMGANITVHGSSALVRGVKNLKGAPVMATDLRASVSLILAGLAAEGETTLSRIYHLDRGYEKLEEKLANCGAQIERLT